MTPSFYVNLKVLSVQANDGYCSPLLAAQHRAADSAVMHTEWLQHIQLRGHCLMVKMELWNVSHEVNHHPSEWRYSGSYQHQRAAAPASRARCSWRRCLPRWWGTFITSGRTVGSFCYLNLHQNSLLLLCFSRFYCGASLKLLLCWSIVPVVCELPAHLTVLALATLDLALAHRAPAWPCFSGVVTRSVACC
jgi:hypothetical protein